MQYTYFQIKMEGRTYTIRGLFFCALVAACRGQQEVTAALGESEVSTPAQPDPASAQPVRNCAAPGQICATCDSVSVCIGNGDGSLTTVTQACGQDEHCVAGQCVKGAVCNYRPFQCSEEGFFPDPYDCTKYHVCVPSAAHDGLEQMSFQCSDDSSYDALSAGCGFPLNTTSCLNRPVPECTARLEIGALDSDPNLYYICVERDGTLAPELHKCPGGAPFKADKFSCKEETKKKSKKSKS